MIISEKSWQKYIGDLRKLSNKAAELMTAYLETHDYNTREGRQAAIEYGFALAVKYGEGAAEKACQMYDAISSASKKSVPAAEPAATATIEETGKAINGTLKWSQRADIVGQTIGRLVKTAGVDTTMKNAIRDGAYWAWVPNGDTCPFCLTLASRGWQKASKKALKGGHAEHIHPNCDCTYATSFGDVDVKGYDPDALLDQYYAAVDRSDPLFKTYGSYIPPKSRINLMRRQKYAQNKDAINAQKRVAYAKRIKMSGGRILNPDGEYEKQWAEKYYEQIRHKSTDCKRISDRTGIDEKTIISIKRYLFFDGKWYNPIIEEYERFIPDAMIAQSWQRLAEGKTIEPHDLTLIKHEELEMKIKKDNPGISHDHAHSIAAKQFNYQKEAEEYYADLRKKQKRE